MSSSQIIEHVAIFKLKDTTDQPSDAADEVVSRINSLISLDPVLHITAAPLHRVRSTSGLAVTHILHSRFRSKDDFAAYLVHPAHLSVVSENAPLVDDNLALAVDWIATGADLLGPDIPAPGSAVRVALWKLKEGFSGDERKSKVLEAIRGIKEGLGGVSHFSSGENFSPERAKGFEMAFLVVFSSLNVLESADSEKVEEKLKDFVDSLLVLDFVVPSHRRSNLWVHDFPTRTLSFCLPRNVIAKTSVLSSVMYELDSINKCEKLETLTACLVRYWTG